MILVQIAGEVTDIANESGLFNMDMFDKLSKKFFIKLLIDLLSVLTLIRLIYYPIYKQRDLFFPFVTFNIVIYMLSFFLNKMEASSGAALGLFVVFSMLRYRTEDISIKDMTYLFICIALGLINAISKGNWIEISILNLIVLIITYLMDGKLLMKREVSKVIMYENIDLIKNEKKDEMMEDIRNRTGINIHRYAIQKIDFLKDAAQIRVFYYEE